MRGLVVPDREEDFTADQVELYFDLAFVFAFSQLVSYLHREHSLASIASAVLLFMMLWLPWTQFTWSANAISSSSRVARASFLVATVACMPMSASVTAAFDGGGLVFGLSTAVIFLMALLALRFALPTDDPALRQAVNRYTLPNYAAVVMIVAASFLDTEARIVGWILGLSIVLWSTIKAGDGEWIVRPGHFAERHGLIVIVALGEVIVAIGVPVVETLSEGARLATDTLTALVLAGIFAGLLWWSYFDRPARAFEHRAETLAPSERGRFARDAYTYCHTLIVAGVILAAAALEEITLHPGESLDQVYRLMLFAGIAAYLVGIALAVWRSYRVPAKERLAALLVVAGLILAPPQLTGLALLALIDLVLVITLVAEHVRVEQPRTVSA